MFFQNESVNSITNEPIKKAKLKATQETIVTPMNSSFKLTSKRCRIEHKEKIEAKYRNLQE